jgi:hypothetical protein
MSGYDISVLKCWIVQRQFSSPRVETAPEARAACRQGTQEATLLDAILERRSSGAPALNRRPLPASERRFPLWNGALFGVSNWVP